MKNSNINIFRVCYIRYMTNINPKRFVDGILDIHMEYTNGRKTAYLYEAIF